MGVWQLACPCAGGPCSDACLRALCACGALACPFVCPSCHTHATHLLCNVPDGRVPEVHPFFSRPASQRLPQGCFGKSSCIGAPCDDKGGHTQGDKWVQFALGTGGGADNGFVGVSANQSNMPKQSTQSKHSKSLDSSKQSKRANGSIQSDSQSSYAELK